MSGSHLLLPLDRTKPSLSSFLVFILSLLASGCGFISVTKSIFQNEINYSFKDEGELCTLPGGKEGVVMFHVGPVVVPPVAVTSLVVFVGKTTNRFDLNANASHADDSGSDRLAVSG